MKVQSQWGGHLITNKDELIHKVGIIITVKQENGIQSYTVANNILLAI